MILYDWTMGRPNSKNGKNVQQKIKLYLDKAMIKGNVNCKLLIVAPDF